MTDWPHVRLKYVAGLNERTLPETAPEDLAFRYIDISTCGRGLLTGEPEWMGLRSAPARARRLVRAGDTIVSTVRTYLRAVWPVSGPTEDLVVSTGFAVLSPSAGLDAGYLGWLMQSDRVIDEIVARSVGVSYPAINGFEIGDIKVPIPPPSKQRAIADYLDTETARIDAVIERRIEQRDLLDERELVYLSRSLVPDEAPFVPVRFAATIQSGLTVDGRRDPGSDAVTRPYLRVANVQAGSLALESVTEITVSRSLAERCTLRVGDVLMTEGGDLDKLGRGTVWRGELEGALHQNHVFAVRPDPDRLSPEYLALLTRTAHARAYFEQTGTKTTNLASTNSEKILGLPIPVLTITEQRLLVQQARHEIEQIGALRSRIDGQAGLLNERRQALITAAVTGQLEISAVPRERAGASLTGSAM